MEIEWTRTEYRFIRNIAQEVDALVDKCYHSQDFAEMFLLQHEGDLRKRIASLTDFMHQAGREGREERVLISKLVMRMRKLLLDLQKRVYPAASQSSGVGKKDLSDKPNEVENKVSVATFIQKKETTMSASRRDGKPEKSDVHDRLFRSRTKSMIISENLEANLGDNSPKGREKMKQKFHTTLRSGNSPDGRSPNPKGNEKKRQTSGAKAIRQPLYHWENGYTEKRQQKAKQDKIEREGKYFHAQNHAKQLRNIANDPMFKAKHHNIGFGRKVAPKDEVRFDPKSSMYTSQYGRHTLRNSKKHGQMDILMDFQIKLTKEEYETYKMLALSVPLERSTLRRHAVQEAAAQATRRFSKAGGSIDIDALASMSFPGSTAMLV